MVTSWRSGAWVIAIVGGLALAGFVFHFPGSYGEPRFDVAAAAFGLFFGSTSGVIVGALMGLVAFPRTQARQWALVMAAAVAVTHAIFDGSSTAIPFAGYALVSGIAMAVILAIRLDFGSRRPPAILGAAWTLGLISANEIGGLLGLPWENTPIGWATDHAVDGLIVGLVWATATILVGLPSAFGSQSVTAGREPS